MKNVVIELSVGANIPPLKQTYTPAQAYEALKAITDKTPEECFEIVTNIAYGNCLSHSHKNCMVRREELENG